jgi:hypothetical protein
MSPIDKLETRLLGVSFQISSSLQKLAEGGNDSEAIGYILNSLCRAYVLLHEEGEGEREIELAHIELTHQVVTDRMFNKAINSRDEVIELLPKREKVKTDEY